MITQWKISWYFSSVQGQKLLKLKQNHIQLFPVLFSLRSITITAILLNLPEAEVFLSVESETTLSFHCVMHKADAA